MGLLSRPAAGLRGLGVATWLFGQAARGAAADLAWPDDLGARRYADALSAYLWRPLPVLALLALLLGYIVGVSTVQVLARYRAELTVEPAVAKAVAREALPLLIGVFAAGRVSVELAARLGAMRMARELDGLELMGWDPARYVLTPALAAVATAAPLHLVATGMCAWLGAGFALQSDATTVWSQYARLTLTPEVGVAMLAGIGKTLVVSLAAAAVGVTVGSREEAGPAALAAAATAAFTYGLLAVFLTIALWTALG